MNVDYDLLDLRAELEQYEWEGAKWSGNKLIAASPFRYDKSPSFYVWLDGPHKGTWGDSGGFEEEYRKGGLVKLLAFLRQETTEETQEYLEETYGTRELSEGDRIEIPTITLTQARRRAVLPTDYFAGHIKDYTYLESRGIPIEVQQRFGVHFDPARKAVAIPWYYANGALANVKYRRTTDKIFWYAEDAEPIRNLVFGLDQVYASEAEKVYVCEGEIDALSLWTRGLPAIALGTASLSEVQRDLVKKSHIQNLVIAVDYDKAGDKVAAQIKRELNAYMAVSRVSWAPYKDANAYHVARLEAETEETA